MKKAGRRMVCAAVVLASCFGMASIAQGTLVTLQESSLTGLLGSGHTAASAFMTTPMTTGTLATEVYSQAYVDNAGQQYAYLWQVNNDLPASEAFVELFTVGPFCGATETTQMGYLSGTLPSGFLGGGQDPESTGNISVSVGPTLSFYYGDRYGYSISSGEHGRVMYALSGLSPDEITVR